MGLLSAIFGQSKKQDKIIEILSNEGIIIDVRSIQEFKGGHVKGSKNIPLNTISGQVEILKKMNKSFVLCCASGMRSAQATTILKNAGIDAVNGGSWRSLQ
ncbi:MAG: rhodanese-like domain-containing protein [Crocinitomicaceae bacterium]